MQNAGNSIAVPIDINGKTAVYGLIGNPVHHSLSPFIQNNLARLTKIDSAYVTFPVLSEKDLKSAVLGAHALGIKGLNVTVPYKKSVIEHLCGIDESAEKIGAVNTLKYTGNGYVGSNTDFIGVIRALKRNKIDLNGRTVLLLGAGGGACAAAFAAAACGALEIFIANRTNKNTESLATKIKKYYNTNVNVVSYEEISSIREGYYIFQATSLGMDGISSPISDLKHVERSAGVFDIIYSPLETKLLKDAKSLRKPAVNGLDMLVFQALVAFETWNGVAYPSEVSEKLLEIVENHIQ